MGVNLLEVIGNRTVEISNITFDSRAVTKGSLFIAVKGTQVDGHEFIHGAVEKGAVAIVCEKLFGEKAENVCYVKVPDAALATGLIARNFYNNPSSKMKVVAVTGTNGKTTVTTLLYRLFSSLNYKCGLLSTVENRIAGRIIPATHTTPDSISINRLMAEMVDEGCEYCFMEASSHAIVQRRINGLQLSGAVFTNLTRDHLDYHGTFENYLKAKQHLFDELPSTAFALSNADDKNGKVMLQNTGARTYYYSLKTITDFTGKLVENSFSGLLMEVDGFEVNTSLVGEFNAYNVMAVYGASRLLGLENTESLAAISNLKPAEGRFDYIISNEQKVIGIVDYAHTPDALEKVLKTINNIRTGNEQIITVVGCGGDRDRGKRPMMAHIAGELSDRLILTSDNPRSEEPSAIIDEMRKGIPANKIARTLAITDRKEAIKTAVEFAKKGDIILLAGKGHEKYQDIKGIKYPFDDKEILNEVFKTAHK